MIFINRNGLNSCSTISFSKIWINYINFVMLWLQIVNSFLDEKVKLFKNIYLDLIFENKNLWFHLQNSNFVVNFHWNQLMVGPWTINGTFHIFFQIKVFQSHLEKTRTTIYLCKTMWEIMRIGSAGLLMGDDIGSGLSSMAICFGFRSTNVVQLSIRNPLFYRFQCHYP